MTQIESAAVKQEHALLQRDRDKPKHQKSDAILEHPSFDMADHPNATDDFLSNETLGVYNICKQSNRQSPRIACFIELPGRGKRERLIYCFASAGWR